MPILNWAIDIDAPAEVVFDELADQRNEERWSKEVREVELLTPEPVGVGSRYRARWAKAPRCTVTYVRYERPRQWVAEIRSWMLDIDQTLTIEPRGAGSHFTSQWDFTLHGPFRLFAPMLARAFERDVQNSIQSAKAHVESLHARRPQ